MHVGWRDWVMLESDRNGAAMLELSLILPVVMLIGFGAIEFGNLIYKDHLLWNGVRDGARYYAGLAYDSTNATQTTNNETAAKNIAVTGVTSGGTARVAGWTTGQVTISYSAIANTATCGSTGLDTCYRGGDNITMVTVRTSYPYSSLGFMGFLGLGSVNLTASHQERIIGIR
jgi:Flp pilus assembly protein TadG